MIRLQKAIADMGITSRRKAEVLISSGKVKVNGVIVTELGIKVDPAVDSIEVQGIDIAAQEKKQEQIVYVALHKPIDYITSTTSDQGESVMDLLTPENKAGKGPDVLPRVYPVGRLDKDSEGLVLLTNDGDLTNQLTHPSFEHEKEYEVTIDKRLEKKAIALMESGMAIGDEVVQGIEIKDISNRGKRTIVTVVLKEGKNRQIRRMFGQLGYHVIALKRTRIGNLKIHTLSVGRWKYVRKSDIV